MTTQRDAAAAEGPQRPEAPHPWAAEVGTPSSAVSCAWVTIRRMGVDRRTLDSATRTALWLVLLPSIWIFVNRPFGTDSAHAYWNAWRIGLYSYPPGSLDAYNYSPAFAQAIYPLTLLPWPAFAAVWSLVLASALLWLLWPLHPRWRWLVALYVIPPAIVIGNVESLLAVAAVVGIRRPAAWAVPLLTKITPGLGPLWFAVRREWRQALTATMATAAVVACSLVIDPELWGRWVSFLATNATMAAPHLPLSVRLPAAIAVVVWGALKNRHGALAVGMVLAMPLWSSTVLLLLTAIPRLRQYNDAPPPPPILDVT